MVPEVSSKPRDMVLAALAGVPLITKLTEGFKSTRPSKKAFASASAT
jgi:hypothetical protein